MHIFLWCWGEVETALREDFEKTTKELEECIKCNWQVYEGTQEEKQDPSWTCPGCDFICEGKTWAQKKAYHKKKCSISIYLLGKSMLLAFDFTKMGIIVR